MFQKRKQSIPDFLQSYESEAMLAFVHRDAESISLEERLREFAPNTHEDIVPVIPVKMSEAWLLFDKRAVSLAAGRPSISLTVPNVAELENLSDPKSLLEKLLLKAAGSPSGRRRKDFKRSIVERRVSVASHISDFAPLEALEAFAQFQQSLDDKYPYVL